MKRECISNYVSESNWVKEPERKNNTNMHLSSFDVNYKNILHK